MYLYTLCANVSCTQFCCSRRLSCAPLPVWMLFFLHYLFFFFFFSSYDWIFDVWLPLVALAGTLYNVHPMYICMKRIKYIIWHFIYFYNMQCNSYSDRLKCKWVYDIFSLSLFFSFSFFFFVSVHFVRTLHLYEREWLLGRSYSHFFALFG